MRGRITAMGMAALLLLGACSGDDSGDDASSAPDTSEAPAESTTTTAAPEALRILVSNDDGYAAEGIDAMVQGLLTLDDVEVSVFAPLENQSGTGDNTTPGGVLSQSEEETLSGYPAVAVDGFPADSVQAGLDAMAVAPHLVVTGINEGQNIGPVIDLSGTVGAARTAARAGVPALAVSQGITLTGDGPEPEYPSAVELALDWITEHRDELLDGSLAGGTAEVTNLNVPTCSTGELQDLIEVPVATDQQAAGLNAFGPVDCGAGGGTPDNDVAGFVAGHPVLSEVGA